MKQYRPLWYVTLIALLMSIGVCSFFMTGFADSEAKPPETLVIPVEWTMTGSLITTDGTVERTIDMTVSGTIQPLEKAATRLNLDILLPGTFPYDMMPAQQPYINIVGKNDSIEYYVFQGFAYGTNNNEPVFFTAAMDVQAGLLLIQWQDSPNQFLVASRDGKTDPDKILEHFRDAVSRFGLKK